MLLDSIDVEPRDLVDGLIEVDNARCAIDVLRRNRERATLVRLERNPKSLVQAREVRQVQPVSLFTSAWGRDAHDRFELSAPCLKVADSIGRAGYPDPDLAAL